MKNEQQRVDTPTPETDAATCNVDTYAGEYLVIQRPGERWVESDFARELERELEKQRRNNVKLTAAIRHFVVIFNGWKWGWDGDCGLRHPVEALGGIADNLNGKDQTQR